MDNTYIIIISICIGIACLIFIISYVFRSTQSKLEKYILEKFDKDEIIAVTTRANFFGLKSLGSRQFRGNSAIVLTKKNLFSIRAIPFNKLVIPIENINDISLPTSFNGRSFFKKLLCIHYTINGLDEAIAWAVKNPEDWKLSIENIINNR